MTRPLIARFLAAPESQVSDGNRTNAEWDEVTRLKRRLGAVLAPIVRSEGVEQVATATGLEPEQVEAIGELPASGTDPIDELSLRTVAAILAIESSYRPVSVRGRIRDHLIVQMSRGPIDVDTVASRYGFGDAETLRSKIEAEAPFPVREYVRLRVALSDGPNRKP
ncbi:DUF5791 family protein [Halodesulfurarchaeum sp.]|uniref:DUF5791 family protein n=1 Tax=Halodesulfurarchaeum sp. TaxID=1980530 RepID=UPI002FC33FD2